MSYEYPLERDGEYGTYYCYSGMQGDDGIYFFGSEQLKEAIERENIRPYQEFEITLRISDGIKNKWEVKKI